MICEKCQQKPVIHKVITRIYDKAMTLQLCEDCYKEFRTIKPALDKILTDTHAELKTVMRMVELMNNVNNMIREIHDDED